MKRRWGVLMVLASGCAGGPPCEADSPPRALDLVETMAGLACTKDDFWVDCIDRLDKQQRERHQIGCAEGRQESRLWTFRQLAQKKCSTTAERMPECLEEIRATLDAKK